MATWFIIFPVTTGCWGMTSAAWQRVSEEAKVGARARPGAGEPRWVLVRPGHGPWLVEGEPIGTPETGGHGRNGRNGRNGNGMIRRHWNMFGTSLEYFGIGCGPSQLDNQSCPEEIEAGLHGASLADRRGPHLVIWIVIWFYFPWPSMSSNLLMHLMLRWDLVEGWKYDFGILEPSHDMTRLCGDDWKIPRWNPRGACNAGGTRCHPIPVDSCFWLQAEAIQV